MAPARDWFGRKRLEADAGGESVRGGAWILASQAAEFLIQLGTLAVLGRLLNPSDYGLIGMAMVFIGVPALFKSAGLNAATIQQRELTADQVTNLVWLNGGLGVVLALIVCALGPVSAAFFDKTELNLLVPVLSLPILFSACALQHQALLRRQMLFQRTALVDTAGQLAGSATAIVTAYFGAGYWALAYRQLVTSFVTSLLFWLACDFRPGLPKRGVDVSRMLRFGGALSASTFLVYFARRIDNVLIGRFFGDGPLGLYDQAYKLLRMPVQQIRAPLQSVSLPAMSALQEDPASFSRYYYRFVELVGMLTFPTVLVAALFAEDLVRLVLGPKWLGAAEIFRWFGALSMLDPVASTRGLVMVAHGHARRYLLWQVWFTVWTVAAVLVGLQWSVTGVAIALVVSSYAGLVPSMMYCFRGTAVTPGGFFRSIARPALASALAFSCGLPVLLWMPGGILRLFIGGTVCVLAYLGTWWFVPSMRARGLELGSLIGRKLLKPRKSGA